MDEKKEDQADQDDHGQEIEVNQTVNERPGSRTDDGEDLRKKDIFEKRSASEKQPGGCHAKNNGPGPVPKGRKPPF